MKKIKLLLYAFAVLILIHNKALANIQINENLVNENLMIHYDYALFYLEKNVHQIEFYYSYTAAAYTFLIDTNDNSIKGNIEFILTIDSINSDGHKKNIANYNWFAPISIELEQMIEQEHKNNIAKEENNSAKLLLNQDFYGVHKFMLIPGKYVATFTAKDINENKINNGNRTFSSELDLIVEPINPSKINISTIQIANNIIPKSVALQTASNSDIFYKNQYYVYPNPLNEISSDFPTLHLYLEIYNANTISPNGIQLKYLIRNAKNHIEFEYSKNKPVISDAIVETISIPLDAMPSGIYWLELLAISQNNDTVSQQSKFYLINQNVDFSSEVYYTDDEMFESSEFATYGNERANLEFEMFKVIAEKNEIATWEKLSELKAKQRFLYRFWITRNPDMQNPYNSELAEYRSRIKYTTTYYSYGGHSNGWRTDRGKIYLKHGEPDYIDRSFATPTQKAYEIWSYSKIQGGGQFCFVDVFGLGNYQLVHSTVNGYMQNFSWQDMISNTSLTR